MIQFNFGTTPNCILQTDNPEYAYWLTAWLSERIDYATLVRILWFGNESIAQHLLEFVRVCTGAGA